jgi:hypothetical protein
MPSSLPTAHVSFFSRMSAILTLVSACALAVLGTFIINLFAGIAADHDLTYSDLTIWIFEHRNWYALAVVPAILCSALVLTMSSGAARTFLMVLAAILLIPPLAALLFTAVQTLSPLYTYQP